MNKLKKIVLLINDFGFLFTFKYCYYKKIKNYDQFINLVYEYLLNYLEDYINEFNIKQNSQKNFNNSVNKDIWVCWWQGEQYMPEFCKMCYRNIVKNTPKDYDIHLITKYNFKEYTHIPNYIIDKMENGLITLTQFSDILRQNLLLENGGIWIDASIWVTPNYISKIDTNLSFWSVRLDGVDDPNVLGQLISKCKWSGFILYGKPENIISKFVYGAMCKYYYDHDSTIDYFIQNMIIRIAYDHIEIIRNQIDKIKPSNKHIYDLYRVMDCPYDEKIWKCYLNDTSIFKLTQKRKYNEYIDRKLTFYGYLKQNSYKKDNELKKIY